jgi:hypothetical protein
MIGQAEHDIAFDTPSGAAPARHNPSGGQQMRTPATAGQPTGGTPESSRMHGGTG